MREIGKQLFEDIRRQAESIINPKINDELDLKLKYKFDWQMNECLGTSRSGILSKPNTNPPTGPGTWVPEPTSIM